MDEYYPVLLLLAGVAVGIVATYGVSLLLAPERHLLRSERYLSGWLPDEHAVSRFHIRWYAITLIFPAFDMETVVHRHGPAGHPLTWSTRTRGRRACTAARST